MTWEGFFATGWYGWRPHGCYLDDGDGKVMCMSPCQIARRMSYLPVWRWKKRMRNTMRMIMTAIMPQKAHTLVVNGKSTFMPKRLVITVRGSMMVLK